LRVESRRFLAEGPQAVREALAVDGCVVDLFATAEALQRHRDIGWLAAARGVRILACDERAVAALSSSVTPQGLVAVCDFVDVPLEVAVTDTSRLVVVGAHVRDPGNAGSLLRAADAAGADAVVLAGSSVDPYNDKAVRASVGSLFHLPVVFGTPIPEVVGLLRQRGLTVLAADAAGPVTVDELLDAGELAGRVAWVFGNEAWGIPDEERTLADRLVSVPIYGRAESLNVATAAAVCLYATARAQRRPGTSGGDGASS
jgi:TrmH family RNA methyltransferase